MTREEYIKATEGMSETQKRAFFERNIGYPEARWEMFRNEKYAMRFWFEHGWGYRLKRQNYEDTVFVLSDPEGVLPDLEYRVPSSPKAKMADLMRSFLRDAQLTRRLYFLTEQKDSTKDFKN